MHRRLLLRQLRRSSHTARSSKAVPSSVNVTACLTVSRRKKFAKLKIKFELSMREHEALLREEQRIQDLSKRLQEQNE